MIGPLASRLSNYFHFFGVRGAFLMQLGRNDEARTVFDRAIALANSSAEAAHIRMRLDRLMRDSEPRNATARKSPPCGVPRHAEQPPSGRRSVTLDSRRF